MSAATLIRRLARERTTFKAVPDAVLWEVVEALMSNPALKIEAVGLSIGLRRCRRLLEGGQATSGLLTDRLPTTARRAPGEEIAAELVMAMS